MSPLEELLFESCGKIDVKLDEKQIGQFMAYKDLLLEWNEKMNLTAITDEREIMLKHFADCLMLCPETDALGGKTVIDVGTGAGFPGVPLKIARPELEVTLLDSLNEVVSGLGLEKVKCLHLRAEDGGADKNLREKFDLCVSRAVADLSVLSEYCLPFVKVGGYFISMKGPDVSEEIERAKKAVKILGGSIEEVKKAAIPGTDIVHSLVIIKKAKPTPPKYPRKAGKAKKEPIV